MAILYTVNIELAGDLDAVARLITVLRKCRTKVEVKEIHIAINNGATQIMLKVLTDEIQWFISKLETMYETSEITVTTTS